MERMKALRSFTDAATGKLVMEGREFECAPEAAAKLEASGAAVHVKRPKPRTARKQARRKGK